MIETRRDASHFLRLVFESSPYFDTGALDTPQIAWQIVVGSLRRLDALGRPQTPGTYGLALGTAVGAIGGSVPRRAHPCAFVLTERVAWTLPLQRAPAALPPRPLRGAWAAGAGARALAGGAPATLEPYDEAGRGQKPRLKKGPVSRPGASGRGSAWTVGSACMDSGDTGPKTCRFRSKYPCAPACPVCVPCVSRLPPVSFYR